MGAVALLALFGLAGALVVFSDDGDDTGENTEDDSSPPDGVDLAITDGGTFTGTDGNDTVTINDVFGEVSLDTGAGDDSIELNLYFSTVQGGDGNDTISVDGAGITIDGGAGNDSISFANSGGDVVFANGGDGDDTLFGGAENAVLSGGEGDDVIHIFGPTSLGAGYVSIASGDAGDDTIVMTSTTPSTAFGFMNVKALVATGGEGADTFVVRTQDALLDEYPDLAQGVGYRGFVIEDFEPGIDQLSVDADAVTEGGVLSTAELVEGTDSQGNPLTALILTYDNDAQPSIRVSVQLQGATDVTWDDVEFIGDQMPTLVPPAVG